ncbi:DUF7927 domain-containing protein [Microbacterium sp. CPCC 204701]|uniref:DUF7927 domain-containing protein n=1 Tax=Microbacterium sp. CPCC 204701 TaxID=2493084 RepID=UPI000FD8564F|nr:DUF11 domain-containing protein [Microbacterium sp. CPCC 204701]
MAMLVGLISAAPAAAAGPAVLSITVTPVDYLTGQVQTTAGRGQHGDRIAYRVDYSCAVEACAGATVRFTPSQPDPHGIVTNPPRGGKTLLSYETWTRPPGSGTAAPTGSDETGWTFPLGDVPAGTSGSFLVQYTSPAVNTYTTLLPSQFYPNDFQIVMGATIDSPNAQAPATSTAAAVTWQNTVPDPSLTVRGPGLVRPGDTASYLVRMSTGAIARRDASSVAGFSNLQAASNYTVRVPLPAEAVYVEGSASLGGTYDAGSHSVVWTRGTVETPDYYAGGGFGTSSPTQQWVARDEYRPRSFAVTYPASNFPEADENGCNFEETATIQNATVTATYLDTARTTKTSAPDSFGTVVSCYDPFARASTAKDALSDATVGGVRQVNVPPDVTGMTCPETGRDDWNRVCTPGQALAPFADNAKYWVVGAYNAGNVPGRATVVDDTLDQADAPVYQIRATSTQPAPTIDFTYQCATGSPVSGSVTAVSTTLTAAQRADGCRYTSATVTSGDIAPGNIRPTDTAGGTPFHVYFDFTVTTTAPAGETRSNSTTMTMSYPGHDLEDVVDSATRVLRLRETPRVATALPRFAASFVGNPVVENGGNAVPGRNVTFSLRGATANIPADQDVAPMYVFTAPVGWRVVPDSASFGAQAIDPSVTFAYRTVTIDGQQRDVVVASWPDTVRFGENTTWPTMTVKAQPTFAVAAGTQSRASAWVGDSRDFYTATDATFTGAVTDAADVDGDGSTSDVFASVVQDVLVSGTDLASVVKEICLPDDNGDCDWIGDSSRPVPVSTTATDIRYRVTIANAGNRTLNGIVTYDILPYDGDWRGSTFTETLSQVDNVSSGLDLSYSVSRNPPRPEVTSEPTDSTPWTPTVSGAAAIRAAYDGDLAPGQEVSFEYAADVGAGSSADARACNSIAIDTAQTLPSEPPAVCAVTAEADVEITVPERLPLQAGRPGVVPFTVVNHGGSADAPASVTVEVPEGLTVTSLSPAGWSCTTPAGAAPVEGAATLTCEPVDASGEVTTLPLDTAVPLQLPVRPADGAGATCVEAVVSGIMADPVPENNDAEGCFRIFAGAPGLQVDKSDGVEVAVAGEQLTYTITVTNVLVGEALTAVSVEDALPAGAVFVSASDGGVHTGADASGQGGSVEWVVDLAPAGTPDGEGSDGTGAAGSSLTRTVTVRVDPGAVGDLVNVVTASAPDPASSGEVLSAEADDTDQLRRVSVSKSSNAAASGVRPGDRVTYTVSMVNDGTAGFPEDDPARLVDDMSGVLDDATFAEGTAAVTGADPAAISPDDSGRVVWSGPLPVGAAVTLTYTVVVGDGADMRLANTAWGSGTVGASCDDGVDQNGFACATVESVFAPELSKRVESFSQNDDGTWSIVYAIDVTSAAPEGSTTYALADSLRFGAGLEAISATATLPDGSPSPTWVADGDATIAAGVPIAAGEQHTYRVSVTAEAHETPGTATAVCAAGAEGGFANAASLSLPGRSLVTAEACASPVEPRVGKTVAAPVQQPDGSWLVSYTVSVVNRSRATADLAYTLRDQLRFPSGVVVLDVSASGPGGSAIAGFDGAAATSLTPAVVRIPAPTGTQSSVAHSYTVTARVDAPLGAVAASDLLCGPAGTGGYANTATLFAGTGATVSGTADACTAVIANPMVDIAKRVVSSSILDSDNWSIVYEVRVENPDARYASHYRLEDRLAFADEATVVDRRVTGPAGVALDTTWNGDSNPQLLSAPAAIAAGATHVYTVTVEVDPGSLIAESPAADCRVDAGETGTGYRNIATVVVGGRTAFADACEPATDPSVVKAVAGQPVQDEQGLWTVAYTITVTNRSTTTAGTIPYELTDALAFPAGVAIEEVVVVPPDGAEADGAFDGTTVTTLGGHAIGAAASESEPRVQTWTVTVTFAVPAGLSAVPACDPQQGPGGLRNETEIRVGGRVSGAVACVNAPEVPAPAVSKTVTSQRQLADGTWAVAYEVAVVNPSATAASRYTLDDAFALGEGMTLSEATVDVPAGLPDSEWDGTSAEAIATDVLLPAGGSHTYTVRAVIDAGAVQSADDAADCTIQPGEVGTGLGNTATLDTGAVQLERSACAQTWDPGVTKQLDGVPVQQADGAWLLSYTMTVTNASDVRLSYGLVDELSFPAGSEITVESAAGRSGSPAVNADWDGQTELQLVPDGAALPPNAVHVFDVTVRAMLPDDQDSVDDGWANTATVVSGVEGVIRTDAVATADIRVPVLAISKTATPSESFLRIGDAVAYEITIENVGEGEFTDVYPALFWDDLGDVQDDAELVGDLAASPATGRFTETGSAYRFAAPLAPGESVTITYTATVADHGGNADLVNLAYVSDLTEAAPNPPAADDCDDGCAVTRTPLAALQIAKAVDASVVSSGDTLRYTVAITNTGNVDIPEGDPAVVTDDLSGVLEGASYNGDASATSGAIVASDATLTWTGGLETGETATVTYSVTVASTAQDGSSLVNVVTSDPTLLVRAADGGDAVRQVSATSAVQRLAVTGGHGSFGAVWTLALVLLAAGLVLMFGRRRRAGARPS